MYSSTVITYYTFSNTIFLYSNIFLSDAFFSITIRPHIHMMVEECVRHLLHNTSSQRIFMKEIRSIPDGMILYCTSVGLNILKTALQDDHMLLRAGFIVRCSWTLIVFQFTQRMCVLEK